MKKILFLSIPLMLLGAVAVTAVKNADANYAERGIHIPSISTPSFYTISRPDFSYKPPVVPKQYKYSDLSEGTTLTGAYSQFEDIANGTSFLGHGYNIITSPYMNKDYVKFRSPILDEDKLMNARLKIVNEISTDSHTYTGSSMEEFMNDYSLGLSVYGNYGKVFSGGIKAQYRGSQGEKKFFSFSKQEFTIRTFDLHIMENVRKLKTMLSDDFLYDVENMTPYQLFDEYGTHLIAEMAMGGKLEMNTTYSSISSCFTAEIEAAINAHVKYLGSSIHGEMDASYKQKLDSLSVEEVTDIKTLGAPALAMDTVDNVRQNFPEWVRRLGEDKANSAFFGLVGDQSLVPLWDLVDDPQKKIDIETAFYDLAGDSYDELCEMFKLNKNRYITVNYDGDGYGEVQGVKPQYTKGETAVLVAVPNAYSAFDGWYIGEEKVCSNTRYVFEVDMDTELTAKFVEKDSHLDLNILMEYHINKEGNTNYLTVYNSTNQYNLITYSKGDVTQAEGQNFNLRADGYEVTDIGPYKTIKINIGTRKTIWVRENWSDAIIQVNYDGYYHTYKSCFEFGMDFMKLAVVAKNGNDWTIRIRNLTTSSFYVSYSPVTCVRENAMNWDSLNVDENANRTYVLYNNYKDVHITEEEGAKTFVVSYLKDYVRYISCITVSEGNIYATTYDTFAI